MSRASRRTPPVEHRGRVTVRAIPQAGRAVGHGRDARQGGAGTQARYPRLAGAVA